MSRFCISSERLYFVLFSVRFNFSCSRMCCTTARSSYALSRVLYDCFSLQLILVILSLCCRCVAGVAIVSLYRAIEHSDSVSGVRSTNFKVPLINTRLTMRLQCTVTIRNIDYNFLRQTSIVSSIFLFLSARFVRSKSCIRRGFGRQETGLLYIYKDIFANFDLIGFLDFEIFIKVHNNIFNILSNANVTTKIFPSILKHSELFFRFRGGNVFIFMKFRKSLYTYIMIAK